MRVYLCAALAAALAAACGDDLGEAGSAGGGKIEGGSPQGAGPHAGSGEGGTGGVGNILCGNDSLDGEEDCDGADLGGQDCVSLGFDGGTLGCDPMCDFDLWDCRLAMCGDGFVDSGEVCDGANLNGATCTSLVLPSGILSCADDCSFDPSHCTGQLCDNVIVLADPSLDVAGDTGWGPNTLSSQCTTTSLHEIVYSFIPDETDFIEISLDAYMNLTLSVRSSCTDDDSEVACTYDWSSSKYLRVQGQAGEPMFIMVQSPSDSGQFHISVERQQAVCGDGVIDPPNEVCDGANLGTATCTNRGFATGSLQCGVGCAALDTSGCTGCAHDVCEHGRRLAPECDACVAQVCALDPDCCQWRWWGECISEAEAICGGGPCCGNGSVTTGEHCEGTDYQGRTCVTEGFAGGDLSCDGCSLDLTGCALPAAFSETEPNGYYPTPNVYQGATNGQIDLLSPPYVDNDFFEIPVKAGQLVKATVFDRGSPYPLCSTGEIDSAITISDPTGVHSIGFNDDISATNLCSSASAIADVTGPHYVRVAPASKSPGASFPYVLVVTVH